MKAQERPVQIRRGAERVGTGDQSVTMLKRVAVRMAARALAPARCSRAVLCPALLRVPWRIGFNTPSRQARHANSAGSRCYPGHSDTRSGSSDTGLSVEQRIASAAVIFGSGRVRSPPRVPDPGCQPVPAGASLSVGRSPSAAYSDPVCVYPPPRVPDPGCQPVPQLVPMCVLQSL